MRDFMLFNIVCAHTYNGWNNVFQSLMRDFMLFNERDETNT